ncbi:unnamed protein product [Amaranthus hypochondriacus]
MGRAPCCDKANVKKGPWSPEEDAKLKDYIQKYGTGGNWIALPQKAGLKRCGKSCRLRWLNYLRPNIKHGDFSDDEDRIICSLYASIGSRWSIIAAQLPGRTDNDIKNYWNTKLKKKLMATSLTPNLNINHKKTHLNQNHQYPNPMLNYHNHNHNHPSSLLSSILSASSSSSPYHQYPTSYYNSPSSSLSSMTMSFNNNNNNDALILRQNYDQHVKEKSTLLVFGGDHHHHHDHNHDHNHNQISSCSSDGSITQIANHHQVKCEEQNYAFHHNNVIVNHDHHVVNHHQGKIKSSDADHVHHGIHQDHEMLLRDDEKPSCVVNDTSLLDNYGLEEIKQLISCTNNINIGNMSGFNYFDHQSKGEDNKDSKVMYYHY